MPSDRGTAVLLEHVAASLPDGAEHRPGQLEMAERVGAAIDDGRHLVVQAGTGTGKSLAYLLPAIQSGRRVVVATATKALQDQLANKDLPFLAAQDGVRADFTFAVLKGRSNYLCRQRAAEVIGRGSDRQMFDYHPLGDEQEQRGEMGIDVGRFGSQVRRLADWAERTTTGDRAELDFEPHPRVWAALSVGSRECPGAFRCPSGPVCFAERARSVAAETDVVVVNTHLYATHVASNGAVLPDHEVVVFDEVHAVEDVMAAGLGVEITAGRLRALAAAARNLKDASRDALADALSDVADKLDAVLRPRQGRRVLVHRTGSAPAVNGEDGASSRHAGQRVGDTPADSELLEVLELARSRVEALAGSLRRAEKGEEEGGRRARAVLAAGHLLVDLSELQGAGSEHVAWVEGAGPDRRICTLRLAPVEIGPVLATRLWPSVTGVLTSATVPRNLERALGLPGSETDRVDVGSPFPYERCALLYCPTDIADRRSDGAEEALHAELRQLIDAAGGRTLALFTSWRAMQEAVETLRPRFDFSVLAQNELPKHKLLEAFTAEESTCLFATMSFWQGVDVPGPTLSVVAIDRLPFPRPDDPLLQARRERAGAGAFELVDLPRAATFLAQAAGRLIRSSADSGVVAVLDRRLATSGYGGALRSALPPMRFTTKRHEVIEFLASIRRTSTPRQSGRTDESFRQ